jgi:hypothetical protein
MPIVASDIHIRLSGGAGNADPNASIGGIVSSTQVTDNVLNNLFDDVTGSESLPGEDEFRLFYVLNNHGSIVFQNGRCYVSSNTTSTADEWDIGLAAAGSNATETAIANENTAPAAVTFSHPTTYGTGLAVGNLTAGQRYGVWCRRRVDAAAGAFNNDTIIINVDCDTAA